MNQTVTIVEEDLREQLARLQQRLSFSEIADLLTFSLKNGSSELNRHVFGYIPSLFREISITNPAQGILPAQINIGEPVIYKISFPQEQTIRGIPHFYIFCYLKQHSSRLTVYFQSAARTSKNLTQRQYIIKQKRIKFEGLISAFKEPESAICISDPGHFIPNLISSFYVGSRQINFPELIGNIIESICVSADIKLESTFLFGSSAGGMGALLSSTYFSHKVQVMAVNAQIITYDLSKVMLKLLGTKERRILLKQFANRVSCLNRFQQNISSVPNIYLLTNVNDSLHHRNYKFYQLYQRHFVTKGKANQSIFDSYYGVEGHGRPDKVSLKQKIDIAKTSLTMKSNYLEQQLQNNTYKQDINHHAQSLKLDFKTKQKFGPVAQSAIRTINIAQAHNSNLAISPAKKTTFDAYISLGDNCEAGIQFQRIGYNEGSFFRFTSSRFESTFNLIKNDFKYIFDREYIIPRPKCTRMVLNTKYNIGFHSKLTSTINSQGQNFSQSYDFAEVFKNETSKIEYLIDKWNQMMDSESRILFILKNDSSEKYINENKATKLVNLLLQKYKNKNFQILCLQLDKFQEPLWSNPYLINRYFPFFAPRTSAMHGTSPVDCWDKIFAEFPLSERSKYKLALKQAEKKVNSLQSSPDAKSTYPGQISPDNSVIVGKNGWLFINSGTNSLMEYHIGQKRLPLAKVSQWSELLSQRISWHDAQNIAYQHIFIPNKIAVYGEHYPEELSIVGKRPIIQLQEQCDRLFTYPLELFSQYKHQYRLYEKQDCHWSFWGCYLTYQHLCQQLQITPNNDLINAPIEIINAKGDLGSKLGLTEISLRKDLKLNSQLIYDNQVIKYCNQGSIRILKNHTVPHGKIIIFGDSFSNPKHLDAPENIRRTGRLTSLFAETLNEVHFVWTPWIDYDYIEREKPDFVLTEMAERFLVRVPHDHDHLPLEEFAAMRLNQHQSKT